MSLEHFARFCAIMEIVGDILRVRVPVLAGGQSLARYGDLAIVEEDNRRLVAQVIAAERDQVSLTVFGGTRGISTRARVRFTGHPVETTCSYSVLGRVFRGDGSALDRGPSLDDQPRVAVDGPPANPMRRQVASRMIRTNIPMIDLFNSLVESQKISIFSVSGEPYNALLARVGVQADADLVVFGGIGLVFDDYFAFRRAFEDAGAMARTVMYVNLAGDPVVERLLIPDRALAVAEHFAVAEGKRVLVLLTDMTAFADALKEIGVAMERVPSTRGYTGDLYSQLARRYEKACDFSRGGSLTILSVTTMPGDDVTHPVPDNTGYITEGQFYLHGGRIDPFGSLSRLKQHVIGKQTREDHGAVMNTMIRLYAAAGDAARKQSMAFDLSAYDRRLLQFGELFQDRFMDINVDLPLDAALDLAWETLAECFTREELLVRQELLDKYLPARPAAA